MKPSLSKAQRKALRFAYDLMRGCISDSERLLYVRGRALRTPDGRTHLYQRHWIEPDRAEDRPYLTEDVLASLEVLGYMEARPTASEPIWLYRITRDGCDAIGVEYPLYSQESRAQYGDRLVSRRQRELHEREGLYRQRGGWRDHQFAVSKGWVHQMRFNYRSRKR